MKRKCLGMLLLCAALVSGRAWAWDGAGHEQIADIAWTKLNARAKREITAILMKGDPRFRPADQSEAAVRRAFRKAATFPDVIKGDRNTSYESLIEPMNRLFQPHPDPNDRESNLCKTWHYYDKPIRFTGTEPTVHPSNALAALGYARRQLTTLQAARSKDRKMECWWLYWIEHVVGDLHQPLHCTSSYEFQPTGDAGGNLFTIVLDPNSDRKARLHGFWDGGIASAVRAERQVGLSGNVGDVSSRWTHDPSIVPTASQVANLDIMSWITTGASLADHNVYTGITPDGTPSDAYKKAQLILCRKQAVLGGYRLAALLNTALGKP